MNKKRRRVLITGVSSGIGLATAKLLLAKGDDVIGLSRRAPPSELVENSRFHGIEVDLVDFEKLETLLKKLVQEEIKRETFKLDAIICNAGRGLLGSLEQYSWKEISSLVNLNFTSQALLVRFLLPFLKTQPRADLIFIGSEASLQGKRKGSVYCATKFAVRGFAQSLRDELASSEVKVTMIQPGMVDTPFHHGLMVRPDPETGLQAQDIAEIISQVLEARSQVVYDEIIVTSQKRGVLFTKKLKEEVSD